MTRRHDNRKPDAQPSNGRPAPVAGLSLHLDAAALRPLVQEVVSEVLARLEEARAALPDGRLCYSEEEAARLLGLEPHVLRDERRRGRITASQIVGRRIRYTRDDLVNYLMKRKIGELGQCSS